MGVAHEKFERVMDRYKSQTTGGRDTDLNSENLRDIITAQKQIIVGEQQAIPDDPYEQLRVAIAAVFNSWKGRRAVDYRRINRISDSLGTAVNIQAMVFGNMGEDSGTGVAFTRNPSTGEKKLYGEYLLNAPGEDVVAGPERQIDQPAKKGTAGGLQRVCFNHQSARTALSRHAGL